MNRRLIAVNALAAVLVAATAAVVLHGRGSDPSPSAQHPHPTRSSTPRPAPTLTPSARPTKPALPAPAARVNRLPGPVDDRVELAALRFDGTVVTGTVRLVRGSGSVQLLAGFYGADGTFLDDARVTEPADTTASSFRIRVPAALRGKAITVAVGVPGLGAG